MGYRGLLKLRHNPEQLTDVVLLPVIFTLMFSYIFGGAVAGDVTSYLPMIVPGWEDSTLGNMYAGHCISGDVKNVHTVRTGIEYMIRLADWYQELAPKSSIGFFQIGGGIAGDFPICVVPMLHQDLQRTNVPVWGYFCQISEATTSYGGYSGAPPNEKITWGKLAVDTPKFVIESDAAIVAPLMFALILNQ